MLSSYTGLGSSGRLGSFETNRIGGLFQDWTLGQADAAAAATEVVADVKPMVAATPSKKSHTMLFALLAVLAGVGGFFLYKKKFAKVARRKSRKAKK